LFWEHHHGLDRREVPVVASPASLYKHHHFLDAVQLRHPATRDEWKQFCLADLLEQCNAASDHPKKSISAARAIPGRVEQQHHIVY
jgi:hypothetical protein